MRQQSEEELVLQQTAEEQAEKIKAYNRIPYQLIREEAGTSAQDVIDDIEKVCLYYKIYKKGKDFYVEGTNGDYVPARLKYKMCASLINKEARFLFAEQPDITVGPKGDLGKETPESKQALLIMNDLLKTVLDKNRFSDILIKAARDCFIGKRVACLVNFNEEDGITITFLNSTQFLYETKPGNPNVITKFVCFVITKDSKVNSEKRIFKKKFDMEDDGTIYLEEIMYDGACKELEKITDRQPIKLSFIPAAVFINDGLTGEILGESEVDLLMDYEMWYSKLGNADSDAQRKSMNPTKYTVDMASSSTKNLSTGAGAFWDLGSDQNLEDPHPQVGLLEPKMSYSESLKVSLDRIKTAGYEQVDMPNITLDTMQGAITSGKALKAIYWPLIVRCKEKMKMWGPQLSAMVDIIIQGSMVYPNCIKKYTNDVISPVAYEVEVLQNTPLPEDEIEEKTTDLAEVEASVMSKKSYMKKWRGLTDQEVEEELFQIAFERQILDDSAFGNNGYNGDNSFINPGVDDFNAMGINAIKRDGTQDMGGDKDKSVEGEGETDKPTSSFTGGMNRQFQFASRSRQSIDKLNGTQISSLINIMNSYRNGLFSRAQAVSLIRAMGLPDAVAEILLDEQQQNGGV